MHRRSLRSSLVRIVAAMVVAVPSLLVAQGAPNPRAALSREASRLDVDGRTSEARVLFQQLIDSAPDPAARAAGQRAMAMSYAFDSDCANTVRYERMVMDFWKTREQAEPQNAFYQQGEMANEAARVCIDAGDLDAAERWYRAGTALGLKEPEPRTHPASLWSFRLEHALARLGARRGNASDAARHVAEARRLLHADSAMAAQQRRFLPYLAGYVALYTNDLRTAQSELSTALALPGNASDPFMHALLGMAYEKLGDATQARALYQKAYDLATAHNSPAAFARPFARRKLGM